MPPTPSATHGTAPRAAPSHRSHLVDPRAVELVGGVRWVDVPGVADTRGELAVLEAGSSLPFTPARVFWVYGVPPGGVRGQHAHHVLDELLVCVRGRLAVGVDDGHRTAEAVLDDPRRALLVPPMVWRTMHSFSEDAVLLVLASHPYDEVDYIKDHRVFTATSVLQDAVVGPR